MTKAETGVTSTRQVCLTVHGMHCGGCEVAIESAVIKLSGVESVSASQPQERVEVSFDPRQVSLATITGAIRDSGYEVPDVPPSAAGMDGGGTTRGQRITAMDVQPGTGGALPAAEPSRLRHGLWFLGLLLVVGAVVQWGRGLMPGVMQRLSGELSFVALFGLGFLTGFHCIGMCGSFVVGYVDAARSMAHNALSHAAYGIGKTVSYTVIGALFGALGALVTITPTARGIAALLAAVFLILYGLRMLELFPALRFVRLAFPKAVTREVHSALDKPRQPLVTGLLNGLLLGCGPLQAMYIMAAGTGSPVEGASLLFFFGLGTLPPLLGFGVFASWLSRRAVREIVRVSGVLVIFMGLMMLNRGLAML